MSRVREMMEANRDQWDTVRDLVRFGARFGLTREDPLVEEAASRASEQVHESCSVADAPVADLLCAIEGAREAATHDGAGQASRPTGKTADLTQVNTEPAHQPNAFSMRKVAQTA